MQNALSQAPAAESLWRPTITYCLLFIGIGLSGGVMGPALPYLADQSGSTMSQIAILFTARALGNMVGSVVSGQLLDRYQGHRVLLGMLSLIIIGMLVLPISPTLWLMTLVMFGLGFALVSANAGGNVMVMWWHREGSGPIISALHFCFGVGSMLVPLAVMLAINQGVALHWVFWLLAGFMLVIALILAPQRSPESPHREDGKQSDKVYDKVVFIALLVLFGLYVGMEITMAGWITTYGILTGMRPGDAAFLVSILWFSLSGGRLLAMPILRLGYYTALLYGCLILGAVAMLTLYLDWLPLWLTVLLFGLALSAVFPTLFTLGNELVSLNGKRTGLIFLATGVGATVAPTVTGPLIEYFGTQALPLLLLTLLAALALGLSFILLRQYRSL